MNYSLSPLQIRDWIRANIATLGIDRISDEIEKISAAYAEVGAADPTLSILVTSEMQRLAGIKPPRSWAKEMHDAFERLPLKVARYVVERRELDLKAVHKCQMLEAAWRKQQQEELKNGNATTPAA
jgi:hypothetical protein